MGRWGDYGDGGYDEYSSLEESLIPGDNDRPLGPSDVPIPPIPDAPSNMTRIPDISGGQIPISHYP